MNNNEKSVSGNATQLSNQRWPNLHDNTSQ